MTVLLFILEMLFRLTPPSSQPTVYDESSLPPELTDIPLPACPTVRDTKEKEKKFKEKTVSSGSLGLSQGAPVAFKKRKIASGARNVRQKGDDD